MPLKEVTEILKRLFHNYVKYYFTTLLFALGLSLVVAGSTASIAWLLDPAVKMIFIEQDQTYKYLIPFLIVLVT